MVVAFFVLTIILFPFGVGPEPELLARIAAGILWVTALLAALLSLERLFQADYEDGSLEALALMPLPLEAQVLAKCLAHWLVTGLPLTLMAPLLALLLHLDAAGYPALAGGHGAGHADPQPDRRGRRGTDVWGRGAAACSVAAGAAALYSGADLRRRRYRGEHRRLRRAAAFAPAGGAAGWGAAAGAACRRGRLAPGAGVTVNRRR